MYLKFGFGRATQDAGIEIRRGALSRDQAKNLVRLYDGIFPEQHLNSYLKYFNIPENNSLIPSTNLLIKNFLKRQTKVGNLNLKLIKCEKNSYYKLWIW